MITKKPLENPRGFFVIIIYCSYRFTEKVAAILESVLSL